MTACQVIVAPLAEDDLDAALSFLVDEVFSRQAAEELLADFENKKRLLATLPRALPLVTDTELRRRGYRWSFVGQELLFYTVNEIELEVWVERILPARSDWTSIIGAQDTSH